MSENNPTASGSDSQTTDQRSAAEQRRAVRARYARIATGDEVEEGTGNSCCNETGGQSCDDGDSAGDAVASGATHSELKGYSESDCEEAAEANLGLGCGNPTGIAGLSAGDSVLDLGSGAGFDCFLAAREVGDAGRVIGVDMTPEMVEKARDTVAKRDASNVEFRLGEIEHLPVADGSVDVVISNCVINLSPEKQRVFDEAFRVLRPGGRLAISDVVLTAALPDDIRGDMTSLANCVSGASSIPELESMLDRAGFVDIAIEPKEHSEEFIREWDSGRDLSEYLVSATIEGKKPDR
jgi:arsenite methyltransferase